MKRNKDIYHPDNLVWHPTVNIKVNYLWPAETLIIIINKININNRNKDNININMKMSNIVHQSLVNLVESVKPVLSVGKKANTPHINHLKSVQIIG